MKGALAASTLALTWCASACVPVSALSARRASVERIAERARTGGARACAPEELALAEAHLRFFALETRAGDDTRAGEHLTLAELNARAAEILTRSGCSRELAAASPRGVADAPRNRKQVHASPTSPTTLAPRRDPRARGPRVLAAL